MKTKIICIIFLMISFTGFTQTGDSCKLKPQTGNFSIELDFLPFSDDGPIDLNAFRGRFFFNNKIALRIGFNLNQKKQTNEIPNIYNIDGNKVMLNDKIEQQYIVMGINFGAEYHLLDSKRVSPYLGIDFGFENKSSKYSDEKYEVSSYPLFEYKLIKTEIENAWETELMWFDQSGYPRYSSSIDERAYNSYKINIITGTDIYILKHLYMGVELGLGINIVKYKEVTIKQDGVMTLKYPEIKDNEIGLNFNNAIRLGFWF